MSDGRSALALLSHGYSVTLTGRRTEALEATVALAAGDAKSLVVGCDVGDQASVADAFAKTKAAFGRLDLLFNNAGISTPPIPLEELSFEAWQAVVDTNLTGAFLCTQEALRLMKAQDPAGRAHHQQRLHLR